MMPPSRTIDAFYDADGGIAPAKMLAFVLNDEDFKILSHGGLVEMVVPESHGSGDLCGALTLHTLDAKGDEHEERKIPLLPEVIVRVESAAIADEKNSLHVAKVAEFENIPEDQAMVRIIETARAGKPYYYITLSAVYGFSPTSRREALENIKTLDS